VKRKDPSPLSVYCGTNGVLVFLQSFQEGSAGKVNKGTCCNSSFFYLGYIHTTYSNVSECRICIFPSPVSLAQCEPIHICAAVNPIHRLEDTDRVFVVIDEA